MEVEKQLFSSILLVTLVLLPATAQEPQPGTATLLFKSTGDAKDVVFHTSTSTQPCDGLTRAAGVYDAELLKQKLLPFVARMVEKTHAALKFYPQVEVQMNADGPVQVLGQSNWHSPTPQVTTAGQCGPFTQQFQPQPEHKYLVQFKFAGHLCSQSIQDITDPDAPAPVDARSLECKRPDFR
ncbi:hypothetical protein IP92_01839 [Pseudoduganella flava]|uniref:Secreted protein n=1 Tax=Pseudoduganella flava TaxID=871742 RepID=A0A562PWA4_9BURK|nr:hypothetical protein [Pseudoduganella flava]QGZ39555.1 hypothetical protein GO485_11190 [Pseudoduganella flava]TWI48450.1 hypothetical protein IP92_01839 [Pseudoduganella flava]